MWNNMPRYLYGNFNEKDTQEMEKAEKRYQKSCFSVSKSYFSACEILSIYISWEIVYIT